MYLLKVLSAGGRTDSDWSSLPGEEGMVFMKIFFISNHSWRHTGHFGEGETGSCKESVLLSKISRRDGLLFSLKLRLKRSSDKLQ
ncbi:hypothetical protein AMECASPLE_016031 [Ameca splendens]|uniref:Uncharacterized protein n=1 Tax=Ameca splendens TaxID=208324 RepID=A0ABV0XR17_9TELE